MNQFNRYLKFTAIFGAIIFLSSCSKKDSKNEKNEFFSLDKTNLGVEFNDNDLGITFFPPKDWILMQSSLSKKIVQRNGAKPEDSFVYQPVYAFFDKTTGGFLSIGKVTTNDSSMSISAKLNYYKGLLTSKYQNSELSVGRFSHENIIFTQFKFTKENLISLKLIFENESRDIIEMDYTIPKDYLTDSEKTIKSSIGSVKLL